jgi:hypothetical protein
MPGFGALVGRRCLTTGLIGNLFLGSCLTRYDRRAPHPSLQSSLATVAAGSDDWAKDLQDTIDQCFVYGVHLVNSEDAPVPVTGLVCRDLCRNRPWGRRLDRMGVRGASSLEARGDCRGSVRKQGTSGSVRLRVIAADSGSNNRRVEWRRGRSDASAGRP